MEKILQIKNLSVNYYRDNNAIKALLGVSLDLFRNETLSLVGESGCGKSTLAYSILRLIAPAEGEIMSGEILFGGAGGQLDLLKIKDGELRRIRGGEISMIFQDPFSSLNPVITAGEQIRETLAAHNENSTAGAELKEKSLNMLEQVKLENPSRIYDAYPHQLSGGQRQRVCIAIALATNPRILIADEPTTALDVITADGILELMWSLQEKLKMSVIFITHNLHLAFRHSRRIAVMYAGEIVEEGISFDIIKAPKHPYTRMLFDVIPSPEKKGRRLPFIPGQVPDMVSLPAGCKFRPRCDKAGRACPEESPGMVNISETHKVRCLLYENTDSRQQTSDISKKPLV